MLTSNIKSFLIKHDAEQICLGDIVKNVVVPMQDIEHQTIDFITFPHAIIMSQSCDLQQGGKIIEVPTENSIVCKIDDVDHEVREFKPYYPSVLILPLFNAELFKSGTHLVESFKMKLASFNRSEFDKISAGKEARYNYIKAIEEYEIPDSVIDFKIYFTISFESLLKKYKEFYVISLNELFREALSQKYINYLGRIGLPEL